MDDFSNSVMVALLPTSREWCKVDLPHLTLVFAGEISDHSPTDFNAMAKDACTIASIAKPTRVRVLGPEVFGDQEKVDVLRLELTTELLAMRTIVDHWDVSEYPFRPHVTVGPVGTITSKETPILDYEAKDKEDSAVHMIAPWNLEGGLGDSPSDYSYDEPTTKTCYYVDDCAIPYNICFDRVMVGWGAERLTFNFNRGY